MTDIYSTIPGAEKAEIGSRVMLLLVGRPFSGKTWAASTFPNPVFFDFDHKAKPGTMTLPFWKREFVNRIVQPASPSDPPNQRDALITYLEHSIGTPRLPDGCTIVIDTGTSVEAAFHRQTEVVETVPISSKTNKPDGYYVWRKKIEYFSHLHSLLKAHAGHVIYNMHEQDEKTDSGNATGRVKVLMTGGFSDQIPSHFTAMFRQRIALHEGKTYYVWDTAPTLAFDCNNCYQIDKPVLPAHYDSLVPYLGKISEPTRTVSGEAGSTIASPSVTTAS